MLISAFGDIPSGFRFSAEPAARSASPPAGCGVRGRAPPPGR